MSARRAGAKSGRGTLVIIGGHEDKEGTRDILREVARLNGDRPLVIATLASHTREGYFESYQQGFADLDVGPLRELYLDERDDARQADTLDLLTGAGGLFFSGGDQLRITSLLAQTPLDDRVRALYDSGGVIAGTSAGASVLCETMLVSGHSDETYRVGEVQLAPGLGLIQGVLIDQHFAERGRTGRLLGAVALNPRALGIGLDEDTAIVVRGTTFEVIGQGGVYVIDGAAVTHSNVAEAHAGEALSLHGTVLHVLSAGDHFDLRRRAPLPGRERTREP